MSLCKPYGLLSLLLNTDTMMGQTGNLWQEVVPLHDKAWQNLHENIKSADNFEKLKSVCEEVAQRLGFDYYGFSSKILLSLTQPYLVTFTNLPDEWVNMYIEEGYFSLDPILSYADHHYGVYTWEQCGVYELPENLLQMAEKHGLKDGLASAVHGPAGEISVLEFIHTEVLDSVTPNYFTKKVLTQWFAAAVSKQLYIIMPELVDHSNVDQRLSEREKDCLRWAAEGKTSWEIGKILEIAESTVVHHLRNAGLKMGTSKRQGAVTKALASGELNYSWQAAADKHLYIISTSLPGVAEA